ncbi:PorP/SprF family type IX secretion system membrane protein [Parapedobacter indicus]|uniref:Type IX secretion system membrane protein, PorP/SprF family n=1 Tax=Parapedobacter indicus TaxID=1477437 RepID=A0A1I3DEB5_9SPHI|nr:PorP/SprF family type IX secretion system membrane protein [Parapedobacter indicus]PPL04638.1 type IX secretion system PorP/SprF family membrane protein [Parapedobacter indicus]SFH85074.1 type IX secretion system membrane protein, PorP/SprF family [Parapedobacter indicus]
MKGRLLITAGAILCVSAIAHGQQALTHTQYGQLRTVINPAASLISQGGEISVIGRRQWVGLDGAPTVFWGSGYMGFRNFGATVGITIRHESLAVEKLTEAGAFFAKSVRISEAEYIGLSLNAGVSYLDGRFSQLDPQDPAFGQDIQETDALVGFGVVLYRPERYYVGLSLPRLMLGSLGVDNAGRYNFRNLYHLTAGALFDLGVNFQFRPSLLVTYAESLRPQSEISAMVFVKRTFGLGLNVRSYGEVAGLVHFNFGNFRLGYSYQFNPRNEPLNRRLNNNTHEIGLSYRLSPDGGLL